MPIFDAGDVDYLVNHFDLPGLRHQARACDIQASVCRTVGDDKWADTYLDLEAAFELAIDILRSREPRKLATPSTPGKEPIDVDAVKHRSDVVAIVERYTKLSKSGSRFNGKCPLHDSKGKPLTVYPENQSWYCFHCGKGGDVVGAVMTFENLDFQRAIEALA